MELNLIFEKLKNKPFKKDSVPHPKDEKHFSPATIQNIEIGCGVGLHPIDYAKTHPEEHLVAIEHTRLKYEKFHRRFQNHQLFNLLPLHENAISWITHKVPNECINQIFLLYPNPNPKSSDWNKRWFCMPFFSELVRVLKPGGLITLATNEKFYFDEAISMNEHMWKLDLKESQTFYQSDKPRTHFEKKYLMLGQPCYNLVLQKNLK